MDAFVLLLFMILYPPTEAEESFDKPASVLMVPPVPDMSKGILIAVEAIIHNKDKYISFLTVIINMILEYFRMLHMYKMRDYNFQKINAFTPIVDNSDERNFKTIGPPLDPRVDQHLQAIIVALSKHMVNIIHGDTPLPPFDVPNIPGVYICAGAGKIRNLDTMRRVGTVFKTNLDDDTVEIHITYRITDLEMYYGKLTEQFSKAIMKRGDLTVFYHHNKVDLHLIIPSTSTLMQDITNRKCIVNVMSLKVLYFGRPKVKLFSTSLFKGYVSRRVTKKALIYMDPSLLEITNNVVNNVLFETLSPKGSWVCRRGIRKMRVVFPQVSKKFYRYCGDRVTDRDMWFA